ncbi:Di-N-acetylchitobiase [Hypsibius exemplaris]|uniref:Di-N-acetylchitobiase n=1 Tax=Hypsibius exemplaris TaxID=2072580 RepID=A0A9X6RN49_HYPEX|nr:Di-N-acetylchitobiase [Hypsibius exemplaris]
MQARQSPFCGVFAELLCFSLLFTNFPSLHGAASFHRHSTLGDRRACPCEDARLCEPISKTARKEVYGFATNNASDVYLKYDWSKLTTLAMWEFSDELMCFAHGKGVRLDLVVSDYPVAQLTNDTFRRAWVASKVAVVKDKFLDGINFDPEYPIALGSPERKALIDLVNETRNALVEAIPGAKLSFDVAWASSCVDRRCYDYQGLAEIVDFLFVMSYDVQGQVWGPDCIAMSNTPLLRMIDGIRGYLALDIPSHKLVLGLPWYGYDYPCVKLNENDICEIPRAEYHGAPCSDLVGSQKQIDEILTILENSTNGRHWNLDGEAPQFNYKNATGHMHQVHYDDPQSLLLRYLYAVQEDLRGVGFWHVGCMTDMTTPKRQAFRKEMWELIPNAASWDTYIAKNPPKGHRM